VIVEFPAATPSIAPVVLLIVTLPLLALHVPPLVALLRVKVVPTHGLRLPVIAPGSGFTLTVTVLVVEQPALLVTVTL
jgi:hypothetical protein